MPHDRVKAFLDGDVMAASLVARGDLHAACLARAAKAKGVVYDLVEMDISRSDGTRRSLLLLRLFLPSGTAYFSKGRLMVGGKGAQPLECRHINFTLPKVVDSKLASKDLIRILGFPAPLGRSFPSSKEEAAVSWFRAFGRPVCIKPDKGSQGTNVFPALTDEAVFRHAFRAAASDCPTVVVEEHAEGEAVRFFFVRPKVVGVRIDKPANVVGDGVSSITQLIAAKNVEKKLRTGHVPIAIDDDLVRALTGLAGGLNHVPASGFRLYLRGVSNGSKGGDSFSYPDKVHPSYAERIEAMCNAIDGFEITAVDTKVADPSVPAHPDNYRVLEINSNPGLVPYHFPWEGDIQDISSPMIDRLLKLFP